MAVASLIGFALWNWSWNHVVANTSFLQHRHKTLRYYFFLDKLIFSYLETVVYEEDLVACWVINNKYRVRNEYQHIFPRVSFYNWTAKWCCSSTYRILNDTPINLVSGMVSKIGFRSTDMPSISLCLTYHYYRDMVNLMHIPLLLSSSTVNLFPPVTMQQ